MSSSLQVSHHHSDPLRTCGLYPATFTCCFAITSSSSSSLQQHAEPRKPAWPGVVHSASRFNPQSSHTLCHSKTSSVYLFVCLFCEGNPFFFNFLVVLTDLNTLRLPHSSLPCLKEQSTNRSLDNLDCLVGPIEPPPCHWNSDFKHGFGTLGRGIGAQV